jgi:hypothetical protein
VRDLSTTRASRMSSLIDSATSTANGGEWMLEVGDQRRQIKERGGYTVRMRDERLIEVRCGK